jgi:polyisoprenoid-binding protein YceI
MEIDGDVSNHGAMRLFGARTLQIDPEEFTMSVISHQDRLAGAWNVSAVNSTVMFSVSYVVASFRASFEEVAATLVDGKLSGAAKVASVDVKDENLRAHLMRADFFDAYNHPEITFTSDELKISGDTVQLDGELTIKGITNPLHATGTVEGPIEDSAGNTRLGFSLKAMIDRTAYGVSWNADLPGGGRALSDDVELTAELEFIRAA